MHPTRSKLLAVAILALGLSFAAGRAFAADGAELYKANCQGCHGADGKADTAAAKAMKVKPIAGLTMSPEEVVKFLKTSDKHKAVRTKLSDEDLLAIAKALPGH